jgi:hypothetical protein
MLGHGGALVLALRHGDQPVRFDSMGEDSCSGSWKGKPEVQWGRLMYGVVGGDLGFELNTYGVTARHGRDIGMSPSVSVEWGKIHVPGRGRGTRSRR